MKVTVSPVNGPLLILEINHHLVNLQDKTGKRKGKRMGGEGGSKSKKGKLKIEGNTHRESL